MGCGACCAYPRVARTAPEDPKPSDAELKRMGRTRLSVLSRESAGSPVREPGQWAVFLRLKMAAVRSALSLRYHRVEFNPEGAAPEPLTAAERDGIRDWMTRVCTCAQSCSTHSSPRSQAHSPSSKSTKTSRTTWTWYDDDEELLRSPSFQSEVDAPPQRLTDRRMIQRLQQFYSHASVSHSSHVPVRKTVQPQLPAHTPLTEGNLESHGYDQPRAPQRRGSDSMRVHSSTFSDSLATKTSSNRLQQRVGTRVRRATATDSEGVSLVESPMPVPPLSPLTTGLALDGFSRMTTAYSVESHSQTEGLASGSPRTKARALRMRFDFLVSPDADRQAQVSGAVQTPTTESAEDACTSPIASFHNTSSAISASWKRGVGDEA